MRSEWLIVACVVGIAVFTPNAAANTRLCVPQSSPTTVCLGMFDNGDGGCEATQSTTRRGAYVTATLGAHASGVYAENGCYWDWNRGSYVFLGGFVANMETREYIDLAVGTQSNRELCRTGVTSETGVDHPWLVGVGCPTGGGPGLILPHLPDLP